MKTVSDDLFRLIKSLNKSEKGYFKKFAAKNAVGSKQNYIVLFDAIDRMESYDETVLRTFLKKESFISQLAVYKVYLFNLILKSLNQYGSIDNSSVKIRELLDNSKTLSSKALYKEALKQLKKAKDMAVKFSSYIQLLEILVSERNIISVMPDKNITEARKKVFEEQNITLGKIKKLFEYSWLSDQMVIHVEQKGDFTSDESLKQMERIYKTPLISSNSESEDLNMKFYQLHTRLFYHLGKNDLENVRKTLKMEIDLLEENRHFIDENPNNYSSALINYLLFAQITGARKEVLETISRLNILRRKLKNKVPLSLQIKITFHAANSEMLVYRSSCDMRRGRNVIKRIEQELPGSEAEIPPQLKVSLFSNIVSFMILDENYSEALKLNNRIIDETGLDFKNDIHRSARLLNLVIHLELKNYDLLEYQLENSYKYFRDKNILFPAEKALFTHFKRLVSSGEFQSRDLFGELYFALNKLPLDNNTTNLFTMFDFRTWAKAKSEGRTLIEVTREKNSR